MDYQRIRVALAALALATVTARAAEHKWSKETREPVHHVFNKATKLDVDNVNGFITVLGDGTSTVRVDGEKIIRAAGQQELERAGREVTLDINEKDGVARLYVNGPFRGRGYRGSDRDYEVTYNLTVHVPHDIALQLNTVNGDVKAEQTNGSFEVRSVNGAIQMSGISGSGNLTTVNGELTAAFRQNPTAACQFRSVNGRMEVSFQPSLAADLSVHTVNGAAYTDFDTAGHGAQPLGRRAMTSNTARAGAGGPLLTFNTVNGEIRIRKAAGR